MAVEDTSRIMVKDWGPQIWCVIQTRSRCPYLTILVSNFPSIEFATCPVFWPIHMLNSRQQVEHHSPIFQLDFKLSPLAWSSPDSLHLAGAPLQNPLQLVALHGISVQNTASLTWLALGQSALYWCTDVLKCMTRLKVAYWCFCIALHIFSVQNLKGYCTVLMN